SRCDRDARTVPSLWDSVLHVPRSADSQTAGAGPGDPRRCSSTKRGDPGKERSRGNARSEPEPPLIAARRTDEAGAGEPPPLPGAKPVPAPARREGRRAGSGTQPLGVQARITSVAALVPSANFASAWTWSLPSVHLAVIGW